MFRWSLTGHATGRAQTEQCPRPSPQQMLPQATSAPTDRDEASRAFLPTLPCPRVLPRQHLQHRDAHRPDVGLPGRGHRMEPCLRPSYRRRHCSATTPRQEKRPTAKCNGQGNGPPDRCAPNTPSRWLGILGAESQLFEKSGASMGACDIMNDHKRGLDASRK